MGTGHIVAECSRLGRLVRDVGGGAVGTPFLEGKLDALLVELLGGAAHLPTLQGTLGTQVESLTRRVNEYLLLGTCLNGRSVRLKLNYTQLTVTPNHIEMTILKEHGCIMERTVND